MHHKTCRSITVMMICVLAALVSAQVTFSRDWTGGKRSPPAVFDCSQFARLCRHLIHELKEGISEDKRGQVVVKKHRRVDFEDLPVTYEDDK